MSRTERTRYDGKPIADGHWGKRCPETNCAWCRIGKAKKWARRRLRQQAKIKGQDDRTD